METIDTNTLVTATGGNCFPPPPYAPFYHPRAAARWAAYSAGYAAAGFGYPPPAPRFWGPRPYWY